MCVGKMESGKEKHLFVKVCTIMIIIACPDCCPNCPVS